METTLYDYDIYPKVFLRSRATNITVEPKGAHAAFTPHEIIAAQVRETAVAEERRMPGSFGTTTVFTMPDGDGRLVIPFSAPREGMYQVQLFKLGGHFICELRIYALDHDMAGLYPLRGDLHLHSCRSDGHEAPAVVAANYRGFGYDFAAITDHERYYPSLEARAALGIGKDDKSEITDMLVATGEEIQLPLSGVHYINFGGKFSVNGLVKSTDNYDIGDGIEYRSLDGDAPDAMTEDEYKAMIREKAKTSPRKIESEKVSYAAIEWIYSTVKKAGGLAVFPHPYWLTTTMQVSEDYTKFLYERAPFDAFEVLGGERYYSHNGFQTALYYEMKARGYDRAVVGSTDSHAARREYDGALICSTIAFAKANTTEAIIEAVKTKHSVAVDTISREYRLVGDFRLVKYASFLMENYYPLHDEACRAEGYYLGRYVAGDADARKEAEAVLRAMKGHVPGMMRRYFDIEG